MIVLADEKLKNRMTKDGSHLKQTRSSGGAGAGLITASACFAGIGILFAVMMAMAQMVSGGLVLGGISLAIGALMIIPGSILKNKRSNGYIEYYRDKSGYTEEALKEFDAEFKNGEAMLVSNKKNLDKIAIRDAGVFTTHWFKFPFMMPIHYSGLYHVEDIAAIWYQDTFVRVGTAELMDVLVAIDCHGNMVRCNTNRATSEEIIEQFVKRNPKVITSRKFTYQGTEYDALLQPEEVSALYQSIA